MSYTNEEIDKMAKKLNETIKTMPIDGIFKIIINRHVFQEDKIKTQILLETLTKVLGREDIKVIIESNENLN